jgi:uncharacterized protein YrrD
MRIENNAEVISGQGNKVGTLNRVVIDPKNKDVSHLVVSVGFLSDEARVVPMSSVRSVVEGSIILQEDDDEFGRLPEFEETHYIAVDEDEAPGWEKPLYSYPPLLAWGQTGQYAQVPSPSYVQRTERNIPEGLVALEEGAGVISSDHQRVGNVESIRVAPDDRATHLVISAGLLLKKSKLIPTHWIGHIQEDKIVLAVSSRLLDRLPEYQSVSM